MVIKRILKHPRPAATCAALGNCHKYGMPSSHMQVGWPSLEALAHNAATLPLKAGSICLVKACAGDSLDSSERCHWVQVMSFAVITCILLYWHRQRSVQQRGSGATTVHPGSRLIRWAEIAALACLAAVVGWARVYLGYHTPGQVAAGAAVGASFALAWHALTVAAAKKVFPWITTLSARLGIWLRDTLAVEDVHQAEYMHVGGGFGVGVAAGSKGKAA